MIETVVSSTFNFYDIFVRLGPGCILVGCFYCCFNKIIPPLNMSSTFLIVLNIAIAYIAGTLIRAPFRLIKKHLDNIVFGGNPRDIFPDDSKNGKQAVIKEEITRKVAQKHAALIVEQQETLICGQQGESQKLTSESNRKNHFAFSHMVDCLELNGKSGKADRICSLVDMCSSMMITFIFCVIMLGASCFFYYNKGYDWGITWNGCASVIIAFTVLAAGLISACYLYTHYTQMRFSMIVQLYNIWQDKE